LKRTNKEEC